MESMTIKELFYTMNDFVKLDSLNGENFFRKGNCESEFEFYSPSDKDLLKSVHLRLVWRKGIEMLLLDIEMTVIEAHLFFPIENAFDIATVM